MIDLVIRRAVAFSIDFILLAILIASPCLFCLIVRKDCPVAWNVFFIIGILLYFTVSEGSGSGQTLGKRLLKIRLRTEAGGPATLYQSAARVSLILILPDTSRMLGELMGTLNLIQQSEFLINSFFFTASWLVWPISILLGCGCVGLNDFFLSTKVVHAKKQCQVFPIRTIPGYPWIVVIITIGISAVCFWVIFVPIETTIQGVLSRLNRDDKLEYLRLAKIPDGLTFPNENEPEFMSGRVQCISQKWNQLKWNEWSVKRSFLSLPDDVRDGHLSFDLHVQYTIFVTSRGASASTFQKEIAEQIVSKVMRPRYFITIEFVHETTAIIFQQRLKSRFLGFVQPKSIYIDDGYDLFILQPDDGATGKDLIVSWSLLIREDSIN